MKKKAKSLKKKIKSIDFSEKEKEKNNKIEKELEKHIEFCEQEAEGSLNNEICHISLRFNKRLLDIINEEE